MHSPLHLHFNSALLNMEFNTLLFFLLLSFILIWSLLTHHRKQAKPVTLPPSPLALPILGHLYLLSPLLHRSLHVLCTQFGPLIHLRLGSLGPVVVVSSPSMAKEFLKTHELQFASRPRLLGSEYTGEGSSGFTFTPYGPYWKFVKKLCVNELFSRKKLEQFSKIRREEIRWFLESLSAKSRLGEAVDIGVAVTALTNNIICRMAMSTRCSGTVNEAEECRMVVEELIEVAGKLNLVNLLGSFGGFDLFGYGKRLRDVHGRYMVMIERIMKAHEEKMKRDMDGLKGADDEDLMDILLKISQDDKAEMKLSRDNIKAFLQDIFAAGTETSSVAMQWTLAELINHPHVVKKAREEIESVVGKNRLIEESDIPNLPYIQAIVKETLRLHPTAPIILRECSQDCNIAGFDILDKTKIFINIWAIGRDPNYWENPNEFQPERFLNFDGANTSLVDVKGLHFQLLPFGSGRRSCPGAPLALPVLHVTIGAMIQCFDWKKNGSDGKQTMIDTKERPGFTLRMENPLHCIPICRSTPFHTSL